MSNGPSCLDLKLMIFNNPNPRTEECATEGLLLMAAGRYLQAKKIFVKKLKYSKKI